MHFRKGWPAEPEYPLSKKTKFKDVRAVDPTVIDYDLDPGQVVAEKNYWRVHPYVTPQDVEAFVPEFGSDKFWGEFVDVARRRQSKHLERLGGVKPSTFPALDRLHRHPAIPDRYISNILADSGIHNARDLAARVHLDFPSEMGTLCVSHMGSNWRDDLFASTDNLDFATRPLLLADLIGWAPKAVNPTVFALKWHFGQPRPEEVFYAWLVGDEDLCMPDWVDAALIDLYGMNLDLLRGYAEDFLRYDGTNSWTNFTQYTEGSPFHPSCPAMHGGVAGTGDIFPLVYDLDDRSDSVEGDLNRRLMDEIHLTCYNWSHGRDDAGVHFFSDSNLGLEVGSRVMMATLPAKCAEFGADPARVLDIVTANKVDWVCSEAA